MKIIESINFRFAVIFMLCLLSSVLAYHLLVMFEVIPFQYVWGGKLESVSKMRIFESISIVINAFIMAVVAIKGRCWQVRLPEKFLNGTLWILVIVFLLNSVGNLLAESIVETLVFTPLTFVSAILCFRMTLEEIPISKG